MLRRARFRTNAGSRREEKDVLERWAAGGAAEGDPKDLPPSPEFAEGWRIGKPDVIFEMAEDYAVPDKGTIEYQNFYIPTNFTEAKWLQAIEARPGNRRAGAPHPRLLRGAA